MDRSAPETIQGAPGRFDHIDTSRLDGLLGHLMPVERTQAERLLFRYLEIVIEVIDAMDRDAEGAPNRDPFDVDGSHWGIASTTDSALSDPERAPDREHDLTKQERGRTLVL